MKKKKKGEGREKWGKKKRERQLQIQGFLFIVMDLAEEKWERFFPERVVGNG